MVLTNVFLLFGGMLLYVLPCLLYSWWLFRLWRATSDGTYLWLMFAIGVLPFVGVFLMIVPFFFVMAVSAGGGPTALQMALPLIVMFIALVVACMKVGCTVMSLSQMADGRVGFRDLFRKIERDAEPSEL